MSYEAIAGVEQYELPGMPPEADITLRGVTTAVLESRAPERLPDIDEIPGLRTIDLALFHEMAARMDELGIDRSRVIVSLGHQHFDIAENEVLLEEVDPEARILTTRVVKRDSLDPVTAMPTTWRMDILPDSTEGTKPFMACYSQCIKGELYGHLHIHTSKPPKDDD